MWRLARAGDAAGLHRAADMLLGDPDDLSYEGHRARAFALAVERRLDDALGQLNEGWTEDWPFPAAYAGDVARVRFLGGDYAGAVTALQLALRGAERVDDALVELLLECVRREGALRGRALRVVLSGGTGAQRLRGAAAVARAR
jgi:hypothetical protein